MLKTIYLSLFLSVAILFNLDVLLAEELSPTSDGIENQTYFKKKIIALIVVVIRGLLIYYSSVENAIDISITSSSSSSYCASTPDLDDPKFYISLIQTAALLNNLHTKKPPNIFRWKIFITNTRRSCMHCILTA